MGDPQKETWGKNVTFWAFSDLEIFINRSLCTNCVTVRKCEAMLGEKTDEHCLLISVYYEFGVGWGLENDDIYASCTAGQIGMDGLRNVPQIPLCSCQSTDVKTSTLKFKKNAKT